MGRKKKEERKPGENFEDTLVNLLCSALEKRDDFVLTYETGEDDTPAVEVYSGKLLTRCMRGTLRDRAARQEGEGSSYRVFPGM